MSNFSFSQCFQKDCFPGASKGVILWKWVKVYITFFMTQKIYQLQKGESYEGMGKYLYTEGSGIYLWQLLLSPHVIKFM